MLLTISEILFYYNGPQFVEARNDQGDRYLGTVFADQGLNVLFYFVPVSAADSELLQSKELDARALFKRNGQQALWAISNSGIEGEQLEAVSEPFCCWPGEGLYLS